MKKTENSIRNRDLCILSALRRDSRSPLTVMSRETRIPISTIFEKLKEYEENGLVKKHASLLDFARLGFNAKALILMSAKTELRSELLEFLRMNKSVNSLYRVNNGWDFLVEVVFPEMKQVEDFLQEIDEKFKVKKKQAFYIIDEIKKEDFLSSKMTWLRLTEETN